MKLIIDIPDKQYEYLWKISDAGEEPLGYFERVIMRGIPLDDVKAEIEDCSFNHYFEYGEYIGENPIQHRICMTDKVLEILSKAESEDKECR